VLQWLPLFFVRQEADMNLAMGSQGFQTSAMYTYERQLIQISQFRKFHKRVTSIEEGKSTFVVIIQQSGLTTC
jgi:hypothetical protein